jgi:hypothetical protein
MSGVGFYCKSGETALVAGVPRTVILLRGGNDHRIYVKGIQLGFKGTVVGNEPVTVDFIRSAGGGTRVQGTPRKFDADASEVLQSSFDHTYTVEPSGIVVLESFPFHPMGTYGECLPIDEPILVKGSGYWGIRCTADDIVTVMVTVICNE